MFLTRRNDMAKEKECLSKLKLDLSVEKKMELSVEVNANGND